MLSKSATILLGLINETPLNAYEITKRLQTMHIYHWYNIANSTVYATLKTLEKKEYIKGIVEKGGNMPEKTIYSLTQKGKTELLKTLKQSILTFDYDTNIFSIAVFFMDVFPLNERKKLLSDRIDILKKYSDGIGKQLVHLKNNNFSIFIIANIERIQKIVQAEISGTEALLITLQNT